MIEPASYPGAIAELIAGMKLAQLGPSEPDQAARAKLEALNDAALGRVVGS